MPKPPQKRSPSIHRKPPVVWFLVADGGSAQVYVRERREAVIPLPGNAKHHHYEERMERELVPVREAYWEAEMINDYEYGNDRLGRVFESANPARHINTPHLDIHEDLKFRFMHTLAIQLNKAQQQRAFDSLVLIAPPKLLGELKKHLDSQVLDLVIAELPKDLVRYKGHDLTERVGDIVDEPA